MHLSGRKPGPQVLRAGPLSEKITHLRLDHLSSPRNYSDLGDEGALLQALADDHSQEGGNKLAQKIILNNNNNKILMGQCKLNIKEIAT